MSRHRRRITRKGKGRAFLRFLIGEILLIVICACIYLFVIQGSVPTGLFTHDPASDPGAPDVTSAVNTDGTQTIAPTLEPTAQPSPEPTATPIPQELYALAEPDAPVWAKDASSEGLRLCLAGLSLRESSGRAALCIQGHACIEGLDAARSRILVLVSRASDGEFVAAYPAAITPEIAYLSFDERMGANLTQGFYTAVIDVSEYAGDPYRISIAVENGDTRRADWLDDQAFHFQIIGNDYLTPYQ